MMRRMGFALWLDPETACCSGGFAQFFGTHNIGTNNLLNYHLSKAGATLDYIRFPAQINYRHTHRATIIAVDCAGRIHQCDTMF